MSTKEKLVLASIGLCLFFLTGLAFVGYIDTVKIPYYAFDGNGEKLTGVSRALYAFYKKGISLPKYFRDSGTFINDSGREFAYSYSIKIPNAMENIEGNSYEEVKTKLDRIDRELREKFVQNLKARTNKIETMDFRSMVWTLQKVVNDMNYWDLGYKIEYDENTTLGPLPIVHQLYSTPSSNGFDDIGNTWFWFWDIEELGNVYDLTMEYLRKDGEHGGCFWWQGTMLIENEKWIYSFVSSRALKYQGPGIEPEYSKNKKLIEEEIRALILKNKQYSDKDRDRIMKKVKIYFNYMLQPDNFQWFHWFKA